MIQQSAKILVVDDEIVIRDFLRTGLSYVGFQVAEAENGEEALRLAASFEPDVVVLDLMMAGVDGSRSAGAYAAGRTWGSSC